MDNEQQHSQTREPPIGKEFTITDATAPIASELAGNEVFERKLQSFLIHDSCAYRPVRRDGSCFYRSALYGIFNIIACEANGLKPDGETGPTSHATETQFQQLLTDCKPAIMQYFGDFAEDFVDITSETVTKAGEIRIERPASDTRGTQWRQLIGDAVITCLSDVEMNTFDYIVSFARYGVSVSLRSHASLFAPFISHIFDLGSDELSIKAFCEKEVDIVAGECEEVHLIAFSMFFKIPLKIYVIDNNVSPQAPASGALSCEVKLVDGIQMIEPPTSGEPNIALNGLGAFAGQPISLLYRPGHYEILI